QGEPAPPRGPLGKMDWSVRGPALWRELHEWAARAELESAPEWLAKFSARIPCGGGRQHWMQFLREEPPDYSSREALFAWTVSAHNAVNRRLGKAQISLQAAEQRWGGPVVTSLSPGDQILPARPRRRGA